MVAAGSVCTTQIRTRIHRLRHQHLRASTQQGRGNRAHANRPPRSPRPRRSTCGATPPLPRPHSSPPLCARRTTRPPAAVQRPVVFRSSRTTSHGLRSHTACGQYHGCHGVEPERWDSALQRTCGSRVWTLTSSARAQGRPYGAVVVRDGGRGMSLRRNSR